jgi:uncharacterized repeat protein (TIGR01451 family)
VPRAVTGGERVDYTIRLHNSGGAAAVAQVTDPLPAGVEYLAGSASPAAAYDPASRTLSWSDVAVPLHGEVTLSFSATADPVDAPTVVVNTATIVEGDRRWQRSARIVVLPEPPPQGRQAPVVHSLTIDNQDILASREVTLHISASDDGEVTQAFIREWAWTGLPWPRWEVVQSSGWLPFQAELPWTLADHDGVHFVGVWVVDDEGYHSHMGWRGLDFANLVRPAAEVPAIGMVPYMVYYDTGVEVSAALTPLTGDVELYVWHTRTPDTPIAEEVQSVEFTTDQPGIYLFLARGGPGDTYDLSIDPAGGPRLPLPELKGPDGGVLTTAGSAASDLIAHFAQSGFDPLDKAETPPGQYRVFLPFVRR